MTFKVQFNRLFSESTKSTHISFKSYILAKHLFSYNSACSDLATPMKEATDIEIEDKEPDLPISVVNLSTKLIEQSTSKDTQAESSNKATTSYQHRRRSIKCSFCDKDFNHRGDLNKHIRTHSGEKPYECPNSQCKKRFAHSSNLRRHIVVHSGDKPFNCDKCGKSFNRKDKLVLHKQTKLCKKRSYDVGNTSKSLN